MDVSDPGHHPVQNPTGAPGPFARTAAQTAPPPAPSGPPRDPAPHVSAEEEPPA